MPPSSSLLSHRAYQLVLDLVLSGALPQDEPLSERKLADQLSMGRTPVREALRALARDGVVEAQVGRGTFVRGLSPRDLREVYRVRQALEGMAARLAAGKGATPGLLGLGERLREMTRDPHAHDAAEIDDICADFHHEIFVAADNAMLLEVFRPLRLRFQLAFGLLRHRDPGGMRESLQDHLWILDAIEKGDGAAAQEAMVAHLEHGLEVRSRIFEKFYHEEHSHEEE